MTEARHFRFEAMDTLFFRDGRPFDASDEGMAEGRTLFPPSPDLLSSAMRVALARGQGWDGTGRWSLHDPTLENVLGGDRDDPGTLRFGEPALLAGISRFERYYPAPLHLAWDDDGLFQLLGPGEAYATDRGSVRLLRQQPGRKRPEQNAEKKWLPASAMAQVLRGRLPDQTAMVTLNKLVADEMRLGLGRDATTRTAVAGRLYTATRTRPMRGTALGIEVHGLPAQWKTSPLLVPLGGRQRIAAVTPGSWHSARESPPEAPGEDGRYRYILVLAGPLRLAERDLSWCPPEGRLKGWDGEDRAVIIGSVVAAVTERPQMIGGWNNRGDGMIGPMPLVPCLPGGSVLFIESPTPPPSAPLRLGERTVFGYGRCLIGRWPAWCEREGA